VAFTLPRGACWCRVAIRGDDRTDVV